MIDPARLYAQLLNTGLQNEDPPLYQLIRDLIGTILTLNTTTTNLSSSPSTITNNNFLQSLTWLNENIIEDNLLLPASALTPSVFSIPNEIPGGSIDGSNRLFTTAKVYQPGYLLVYKNGVRLTITADYLETSSTSFTLVEDIFVGDSLLIDYGVFPVALIGPTGLTGPSGPTGQLIFPQDGIDADWLLIPGKDGTIDSTAALTYRATAQSINQSSETSISFSNILFDTASFWAVGSPTRLTVPTGKAGKYIVVGQIKWSLIGTGHFYARLYKNGSLVAENVYDETKLDCALQTSAICDLAVSDYLELKVFIDTGSGVAESTVGGSAQTFLALSLCTGTGATGFTAGTGISISSSTISTIPRVGLVLLEEHTLSSSATLDFVTRNSNGQSGAIFQSDFDEYIIELLNLIPVSNAVDLWMRMSTDGGATFDANNLYATAVFAWAHNGSAAGGNAPTALVSQITARASADISNSANYGVIGYIHVYSPLSALYKRVQYELSYLASTGPLEKISGEGIYASATAANACRILFSTGNISSGFGRCYGIFK